MKIKARFFAILMSLAMLLGMFAVSIPVAADPTDQPIALENNTDVVINGITFRFDPLGTHPNSKAVVNPDGTVTLTMREGDLFWIPSVTIDDQSELDMTVLMVSNNGGKNNGQMASGLAWKVEAGDNNAWGEDTDNTNILNLQTAARRRIVNGTVYQMSHDQITKVGVEAGNTDNNAKLAEFIGLRRLWEVGTTLRMKVYVNESNNVRGDICNESGEVLTYDYYALSDTAPKVMFGAVGYCVNWDGDGSNDGDLVITIKNFTVKNALINGVRGDFNLATALDYSKLDVPTMTFAGEVRAAFDGNEAELGFAFRIDESIPGTAELVVKRDETEITRTVLSTMSREAGNYLWSAEFTDITKTDKLIFSLEANGVPVEKSQLTYALGGAYQVYQDSLGEPISLDKLNAVAYSEDFSGLNLTLEPGENLINGQRWFYIRNSEDGSARISDGQLYITGSSYDRILFLDQVYDHINYRMTMAVTYDKAPEKLQADEESGTETGAIGYVGGIFNLQEADESGNQNAVITAVTPDYLYLMQVVLNADGTISPKDERGGCPIGTKAEDGKWSQYWSAVQPGTKYYMDVRSGISDIANGCFGMIPRDTEQNSKGWGNCYATSKSYRTGVMGIFLGEGQSSAYIDDIKIEVQGTLIKVDGEDFAIWGDGKVAISDLERSGEKFLYATVDGALKYAGEIVTANRKTKITTSQVTLSTRKVTADGETGLKWKTEINKADYDRLAADANIKKIELGTVVIPSANIAGGLTREKAAAIGRDLTAASEWSATSETTYTFEGIRAVEKAERDTSYSGVGYLTVIMQDDTAVTVYADYTARNHAYALSDLVSEFHDEEPEQQLPDSGHTDQPGGQSETPQTAEAPAEVQKKGCKGTVSGAVAVLIVAASCCLLIFKKKKGEEQ